ncbi:MarR family winged helix-turn-helix transcriptional regulator [Williamsia sp. SKLECPSW1]
MVRERDRSVHPDATPADEAWQAMAHFVVDNRGTWKRAVTERTGLAFNQIRLLRRVAACSRSITELAESVGIDAPAASVAVTQLERDGLVARHVDPDNRRRKIVSVTEDGYAALDAAMTTPDPAPAGFAALTPDEIAELRRIVAKIDADPASDWPGRSPGHR